MKTMNLISRIFNYDKSNRKFLALGVICSACNGSFFPLFGIFYGKVLAVMVNPADPNFTYEINFNSFIMFLISIGLFLTNIG